ncbi:hypothetical protein A4G20_06330 [Pasteurellaceae bacterium RH1A]|nr:hypothetical protein A4G20_06330 [Pasteurellaceae bacterium RH1A]
MNAYHDLVTKLKQIFQIDRADLDFGIYRILNSRSAKINQFLEQDLAQSVQSAFKDGNPAQENVVYSHLLTFFSRYYDEGDFISQRRYKGDTYAVPYNGEEVLLHWANKDQYYTKSSENFSNYRFRLEDGREVLFRLVEADVAKDNRKENSKRYFVYTGNHEEGDQQLILDFTYQVQDKAKQESLNQATLQAVQNAPFFANWQALVAPAPTEKNKARTLLEKHLTDYTAKNSADYFIHKDLGAFLRRELDFYIKNEVMFLDDISQAEQFEQLENQFQIIKTLRAIALDLIAFLAQLEDFQKKLWLKKKFVAASSYLITLDKIPAALLPQVFANPKQLEAWKSLFDWSNPHLTNGLDSVTPPPHIVELLDDIQAQHPHLVVDTALYPASFQAQLLTALDDLDLDVQIDGLLIHSDNFQALNLLQARYKEEVKCIYIDPPYNTEKDRAEGRFIYKDNFDHSSWITLLSNRIELSKNLVSSTGVSIISIDDNEYANLKLLNDLLFGDKNFIGSIPRLTSAQRPSQEKYFSITNDYLVLYAKNKEFDFNRVIERNVKDLKEDKNGKYIEGDTSPILASSTQGYSAGGDYDIEYNGKIYKPIDSRGNRRRWLWTKERMLKAIELGIIIETPTTLRVRNYINKEFAVGTNELIDKDANLILTTNDLINSKFANNNGTELLRKLGIGDIFDFPKPVSLIDILIKLSTKQSDLILDYFAGSGTTAHAAINLNREDGGKRKYILVEQGEYFDTVLKPRVQKVIYSQDWKEGKPLPSANGGLGGLSQMVKVLKLESYEDTLNNLELTAGQADLFGQDFAKDYLLHYMLDVESRGSLLSVEDFKQPFDYELKIATDSAGAYRKQAIDLVETFNYLLGLRVENIRHRAESEGYVAVEGRLANGQRCLVIWRDCSRWHYDNLNALFDKLALNPKDSEFDLVYLNGDHSLVNQWEINAAGDVAMLNIQALEPEFLNLMFGA